MFAKIMFIHVYSFKLHLGYCKRLKSDEVPLVAYGKCLFIILLLIIIHNS